MPRLRTQEEKDAIIDQIAEELYEKHSDIKVKTMGVGRKKSWGDDSRKKVKTPDEEADIEGWKAVAATVVDILEAHH